MLRVSGLAALLILATVLAYLPALRGGFIWDDDNHVTGNQALRSATGLGEIWLKPSATPQYYPLVHTSFWIEYHLWGLNPTGYHLVNVLLHALSAVLLWRILTRFALPGAWLAAAIFALHPVNVESVAWITERKNVLSAGFYFAAALAYLRFGEKAEIRRQKTGVNGNKQPKSESPSTNARPPASPWRFYGFALALFTGALLSKTVTCSLPAALLLVAWWKRGRITLRDVLPLLPFFALGLGAGLWTAYLEKHHVGASGEDWSLSLVQRGLIAGRALWFYAGKLAWPSSLAFIYPRWEVSAAVWWQWLFPVATLVVVAGLWWARRRLGRGPLVAVLFFAGTLSPALGFINVYPMRFSFVADHFQYLASLGLLALAGTGVARVLKRLGWWGRAGGHVLCLGLLLALGTLTWRQCGMYADDETLWRRTLERNPKCWLAYNNLGFRLEAQGNLPEAEAYYRAALEQKPDYAPALTGLGNLALGRGELGTAEQLFLESLQTEPGNAPALINLGLVWSRQGRLDEAIAQFRSVLSAAPNNTDVMGNLGVALIGKQDYAGALQCFETVVRIRPESTAMRFNLGKLLAQLGRTNEAIAQFEQLLRDEPNDVGAQNELRRLRAASR